ncbi:MAG: alpha/beta hydrolase [Terracidiphilus sp.]|nr:alpha/beta hydrolase [Terracidiphilus sp.]
MQPEKSNAEPTQKPAVSPGVACPAPGNTGLQQSEMPPLVSVRWILTGLGGTVLAAVLCAWCTLCVLFYQGSWQLLYHPTAAITQTPAGAGLPFEAIGFASDDAGQPRLSGWWIPASHDASFDALTARFNRYTVVYLHGRDGDLSNTLNNLTMLHEAGVNVLAFDYRGYGQSQFARPSEAHWRDDAGWALNYLTGTRHVAAGSIVLYGDELGANLALEVAARHPELAGVVLQEPIIDPAAEIFSDPRASLVPARLLMRDRFDLKAAATKLGIASLWLEQATNPGQRGQPPNTDAYARVAGAKKLGWLRQGPKTEVDCLNALLSWLDGLGGQSQASH